MRSIISIFGGTTLALVAGVSTAHADPPEVTHWQVRGDGASASAYGNTACGWRNLEISINEQVQHENGQPPQESTGAWIGFSSYDWCTQTETYGWTFLSDVPVDIGRDDASFTGTIVVQSYTWLQDANGDWYQIYIGPQNLDVDATWAGVGEVSRGMSFSMSRYGKDTMRSRWRGQYEEAEVVLDVRLDGDPVDLPQAYGQLGSFRSGDTYIFH
jgi:hypothetical protein